MQIKILKFDDHINETGLVISLGFFDGMHIAHRTLLDKTLEIAKTQNLKSGIMTFSTHVLSFIKNQPFHHLTNLDEKAKKAQAMGFDYLYIFEVTKDLISLDYLTFIQRFLSCATIVVVGFDFTFGYRGLGNATTLQNSPNFKTIVLDEMVYETEKIGSTRIREALSNGDITLANHLLGYQFSISGTVISGKGRGKYLGFPTANIDYDGYFLPKSGVYATIVTVDGVEYESMANIGDNPTFSDKFVTFEVHIFRFSQSIYGKVVKVEFIEYIREEIKYRSTTDLIQQMHLDEKVVNEIFKKKRSL